MPWTCRRRKHRPTLARAFVGSPLHERSHCVLASLALMSARLSSEAVQALISSLSGRPGLKVRAHLASHAQPYLASPASMLDLRDGGWDAIAGALAGTAWLAWRGWRMPPFRRPLAVAAATGMLVWSAGIHFYRRP